MSSQYTWRVVFTLGLFLNAMDIGFAQASALPPGWKTECVGYYQLSLPAEVEVALPPLLPYDEDKDEDKHGYVFTDGRGAQYSRLLFEDPYSIATSHPPNTFAQVIERTKENVMKKKKKLLAAGKRNTAARIQFYSDLMPEAFRIDDGWSAHLYMQRKGRVYYHRIRNPYSPKTSNGALEEKEPVTAAETKQFNLLVAQSLQRFRPRALFEIPPETDSGLCMPYVFIADEDKNKGKIIRDIHVTFRLKTHPDVEIYFMDDDSVSMPDPNLKVVMAAKRELDSFWRDYQQGSQAKELEGGFERGFRAVHLAGREGVATLVKITRRDDTIDYGYTAYVKGDIEGSELAVKYIPNLMLYVIRTAAHTKGTPMSKNDLYQLAEQIAASVKRRVPE